MADDGDEFYVPDPLPQNEEERADLAARVADQLAQTPEAQAVKHEAEEQYRLHHEAIWDEIREDEAARDDEARLN